jgi:uncharacterized protein (TIGR00661 family)
LTSDPHQVIICPLDWGLGHASRMIPVISRYMECGYQVFIGGNGKSGTLLKLTFPDLPFLTIPAPVIRYSSKGTWLLPSLILQLPAMLLSIIREHFQIKKIVTTYGIKTIVSDNRYGLFCKHAHCIIVTHQISPLLPRRLKWAEYPLYLVLRILINQFDECWIPDCSAPDYNLSGKLSHRFKLPQNARYIGILSRFSRFRFCQEEISAEKYELVVVLSGPEPALKIFKDLIIRQAMRIPNKILVISGSPDNQESISETTHSQLVQVSHLEPLQFAQMLLQAEIIICRSGYSGIMDLVALGKPAILVPTPGQTEQQYLAAYLSEKGYFSFILQQELSLMNILGKKKPAMLHDTSGIKTCQDGLPIKPVSN